MGRMVDGKWITEEAIDLSKKGEFQRAESPLRQYVSPDQKAEFPAESGRYHLYVAWNCPWAHRTLLMRTLKGLEDHIAVSVAAPVRTDQGWVFAPEQGYTDNLFGFDFLHQVYQKGVSNYSGRVTVPVLYDTHTDQIVSNESSDIIRMLDQSFTAFSNQTNFYPIEHRDQIDHWNDRIYTKLNNGVYRAGFSSTQDAYDEAVRDVFDMLDELENHLSTNHFLVGNNLSEADIRLFPTLARFDVGYNLSFKCTRNRLIDFPHLWRYARQIYHLPGVKQTVFFDIYRKGYGGKSPKRNPLGIVPMAPQISWDLD